MDIVGITASTIAVVQHANVVLDHLKHRTSKSSDKKANASYKLQEIEYKVHIEIQDISHNILSSADTSSDFDKRRIELCLNLCHLSLDLVGSIKNAKTKPADLEKQLQDFARSVKLLRDIVTDSATHVMLREQRKIILDQAHMLGFYMKHIETQLEGLTVVVQQSDSYGGGRHSDELLQELRKNLESIRQTPAPTPWQPDKSDPFAFSATIVIAHQDESDHTVLRGKLDSGCDENWLSTEVIARAKLEDQIEGIEASVVYTAFGGEEFQPTGKIDVTWFAANAGVSRKTKFFVHPSVPFDMVVGRIFIADEAIFMFNKPALALRQGNYTKDEIRIIEENARKKGASNEQVAAIRQADDVLARERKRQQKAASRISLSATPGTPTGSLTPYCTSGNVTPYGQILSPYPRATQQQLSPSSLSQRLSIQSSRDTSFVQQQDLDHLDETQPSLISESSPVNSSNQAHIEDRQSTSNSLLFEGIAKDSPS